MSDAQERTENASQKRMKDVRSKGKLQKSQDVTAWLGVGGAAVMIPVTIGNGASAGTMQMFTVTSVISNPTPAAALQALSDGLGSILSTIGTMLAVVVVAIVGGAAIQGGIHFRRFTGKFDQFNPINGLKNVFGARALWQGAKSLLKTAVVGIALYLVIQGTIPVLSTAGTHTVASLMQSADDDIAGLIRAAVISGLALAAADVFVVMRRNRKQTRMTKREVKDENKNTDGDPMVKAQRRSRQRAMSHRRMISAIAESDVVLVNPTEYAIAIKYEPGKSAPRVVAKGAGLIAARIREEAENTKIPMVKDIPLTRALHSACELGQEIPIEFYTAIARVLSFVMALKKRGAAVGVHTIPNPELARGR